MLLQNTYSPCIFKNINYNEVSDLYLSLVKSNNGHLIPVLLMCLKETDHPNMKILSSFPPLCLFTNILIYFL